MTATNPAADWTALALAANSTDDPSAVLVPVSLFGTNAVVTAAVVLAVAAILVSVCTAAFFIHRGVARGFSAATTVLVGANVLALALEIAELARAQAPAPTGVLFALRNMWIPLGVLGLNLLQIQVAAVFQGSLIRLSLFERARLPWVRLAAVVVHIACCFHMYLDGWAPGFQDAKRLTKIGIALFGIYTLFVSACGLTLNIYLLVSVRRNTTQRIHVEDKAMALVTLGRECVRPLQGLIVFVMTLDLIGLVLFVVSLLFANNTEANIMFNGLVQISLAFFGLHMCAETIMFERVVMIFRNKMPKEYVASVGIDNWHPDADVEATLKDMNAASNQLQRRDTLTRLEAIALRQMIPQDGTTAPATAGKDNFEPTDLAAQPSNIMRTTSSASVETFVSHGEVAATRRIAASSSEALIPTGGATRGL